ncbi:MAG TPA: helix-turn-helix domain-containing protein [Solirubrobacterales bacterium]
MGKQPSEESADNAEGQPWEPDYISGEMAKAIGHPTRALILAEVNRRIMSPAKFAKKHDLDVSLVSYHFRVLEKYECLELVAVKPVRGANEHFYKAIRRTLFDGKVWDNLPETVKNKASGQTLTHLLEAIAQAMLAETFDERNDRALAWDKATLDEEGWSKVAAIHKQAIYETMHAAEEAQARLEVSGDEGIQASWAFLFFKSPFDEPDEDA